MNEFLDNFINLLNPGGRVVIISYHSVEDRIVKHKLKDLKHEKKIKLIFKKPLKPSNEEISLSKSLLSRSSFITISIETFIELLSLDDSEDSKV